MKSKTIFCQLRRGVNEVEKTSSDDFQALWGVLRCRVRKRIGKPMFDAWIAPVRGRW